MNAETPKHADKFRRYRAKKKARGLKEFRVWAPSWDTPEFRAEMEAAAPYFERLANNAQVAEFGEQCLTDFVRVIDAEEKPKAG